MNLFAWFQRKRSVTFSQTIRFVMWRDMRELPDAISHVTAMNGRDRRRLARRMRRQQPCDAYAYECACEVCRTHDKLREIIA